MATSTLSQKTTLTIEHVESRFFYFKFFGKDAENDANMLKTFFFFAIFGFVFQNFSKIMVKIR
jgi:hypothetical protein